MPWETTVDGLANLIAKVLAPFVARVVVPLAGAWGMIMQIVAEKPSPLLIAVCVGAMGLPIPRLVDMRQQRDRDSG